MSLAIADDIEAAELEISDGNDARAVDQNLDERVSLGARLRVCWSCSARATVLVILLSPRGPYALCPRCLGRDGEPRVRVPTAIPAPAPRQRSFG